MVDLKRLYFLTGVENKPTVFLFNDTQALEESFLEDISNILSSGEVPNLYKPEEFEEVGVVSFFLFVFLFVVLYHLLISVAYVSPSLLYVLPTTGVSFPWESCICMFSPGIARFSLGIPYVLPGFVWCVFLLAEGAFDRRSVFKPASRSNVDVKMF